MAGLTCSKRIISLPFIICLFVILFISSSFASSPADNEAAAESEQRDLLEVYLEPIPFEPLTFQQLLNASFDNKLAVVFTPGQDKDEQFLKVCQESIAPLVEAVYGPFDYFKIDASDPENQILLQKAKISGTPKLFLISWETGVRQAPDALESQDRVLDFVDRSLWDGHPFIQSLTSMEEFESLFNATNAHRGPVFIKFWTPFCVPCRKLRDQFLAIAQAMHGFSQENLIRFAQVDCTNEGASAICEKYSVNDVPAMALYADPEFYLKYEDGINLYQKKNAGIPMDAASIEEFLKLHVEELGLRLTELENQKKSQQQTQSEQPEATQREEL